MAVTEKMQEQFFAGAEARRKKENVVGMFGRSTVDRYPDLRPLLSGENIRRRRESLRFWLDTTIFLKERLNYMETEISSG